MTEPAPEGALRGEVVLSFAFDVAYEIATDRVSELMSRAPTRLVPRADRAAPKSVPLYRPLEIDPGRPAHCGGRPLGTLVRVYDVGVITVTLRVPVAVGSLAGLMPFHALSLDDGRPAAEVAAAVCADVCRELRSVMTRPVEPAEPEAYTVFCLNDLGGQADA